MGLQQRKAKEADKAGDKMVQGPLTSLPNLISNFCVKFQRRRRRVRECRSVNASDMLVAKAASLLAVLLPSAVKIHCLF